MRIVQQKGSPATSGDAVDLSNSSATATDDKKETDGLDKDDKHSSEEEEDITE